MLLSAPLQALSRRGRANIGCSSAAFNSPSSHVDPQQRYPIAIEVEIERIYVHRTFYSPLDYKNLTIAYPFLSLVSSRQI